MLTRKETLEKHHDSALAQLIEVEINIVHLEKKTAIIKPGDDHDKMMATLSKSKGNKKTISEVLEIIEGLIKLESG